MIHDDISPAHDATAPTRCLENPACPGRRAVLGCALALGLGPLVGSPAQAATAPKWYSAGLVKTYLTNKPTLVKLLHGQAAFFVIKKSATNLQCIWAGCTHEGVLLEWKSNHPNYFHCPSHGAKFTLTGAVIKGPARTPLPTLRTRIRDGQLQIDLSVTGLV